MPNGKSVLLVALFRAHSLKELKGGESNPAAFQCVDKRIRCASLWKGRRVFFIF